MISKPEVFDQLLQSLGVGLFSSKIKQAVIKTESYVNSVPIINIFHSLFEHHPEESARMQPTSLCWWVGRAQIGHCCLWLGLVFMQLLIMFRNSRGHLRHSMIYHIPLLLTGLNAFVRSRKVTCSPLFCFQHFSWSCQRTNMMSILLLLALKPHWLSLCSIESLQEF